MQTQISFYDLNFEPYEKTLDNIIKFPVKESAKTSEIKKSFELKPKPKPADSVKTLEEIEKIKKYFLDRREYRNYCLFIIGITTGYRISDLLSLKFSDFLKIMKLGNERLTSPSKKPKREEPCQLVKV